MRWRGLACVALCACGPSDRASSSARAASAEALGASSTSPDSAVWYDERRLLDATGDGVLDTIQLVARGPASDSLVMTLFVRTHGTAFVLARWESSYDLIDPPDALRVPGPARDSALRSRYDAVLDNALAEPYVDSSATEAQPTRATGAPMTLLFSYGYESTETVVWDTAAKRFVSVFSCC